MVIAYGAVCRYMVIIYYWILSLARRGGSHGWVVHEISSIGTQCDKCSEEGFDDIILTRMRSFKMYLSVNWYQYARHRQNGAPKRSASSRPKCET